MTSLVSLGAKTMLANKWLFARQLSLRSINKTEKLLTPLSATNIFVDRQSSCRLSSSVAQKPAVAHNHSKLWSFERYLSIGLLAVIPASFAVTTPALDYLLALSLVMHVHWGVEAIVVDYIRPSVFGSMIPKLAVAYVYLLSIAALSGLFYFNYTDVGLTHAIRMIAKM